MPAPLMRGSPNGSLSPFVHSRIQRLRSSTDCTNRFFPQLLDLNEIQLKALGGHAALVMGPEWFLGLNADFIPPTFDLSWIEPETFSPSFAPLWSTITCGGSSSSRNEICSHSMAQYTTRIGHLFYFDRRHPLRLAPHNEIFSKFH